MTRLFGGFGADFYAGYAEEYPTSIDSDERVEIYNLYHLLNHANLFGVVISRSKPGLPETTGPALVLKERVPCTRAGINPGIPGEDLEPS